MQYGFVKVCAATTQIKVADVEFNAKQIIKAIKESAKNGSQLTVFPELSLCGYTCGDLFNQTALLSSCDDAFKKICKATEDVDTLVFIGAPVANCGRLYNCAVAVSHGEILGAVPKTYLPNYGEFYEKRNFSSAPKTPLTVEIGGKEVLLDKRLIFSANNCNDFTVAAEICEDVWAPQSPSIQHARAGANIIVNLSCSNETVGKAEYRRKLIEIQSAKLVAGYVYCDSGDGESTTDAVFSGHNIIAENGKILAESKLFENGLIYGEIDVEMLSAERRRTASVYDGESEEKYCVKTFKTNLKPEKLLREFSKTPFIPQDSANLNRRIDRILTIQQKGLEKRLLHTNCKTAVIGISGGLDSALALLVTCRAFNSLGKDLKDIIAVTMPGFGTTEKTKASSLMLIESLGVTGRMISITDSVLQHFKDIEQDTDKHDVTYENAQARMRTLILMDIANQTSGLVVGTGDLSELALGWATYNGDHMSMYGVNCSVPKTLVKYLIEYEAERLGGECGNVLKNIVNTEISPELLPPSANGEISQKTEDLIGPYILHDFFLYYAVRYGFKPSKVQYLAEQAFCGVYDAETIKKWLKNFYTRFFAQQFKRSCLPDGVKIGSVSLSPRGDWRMPSDAVAKIWLDDIN